MKEIFSKLIDIFYEWNQKINLSAIREKDEIYKKHILDSLELNKAIKLKPGDRIIDLGTGGGFPLLPIAITNPKCFFIGIDSTRKKIDVVNDIIKTLDLKNAQAIWTRGEDHKKTYDYMMTRAVGYIDKLMKYGLHLVKPKGKILLYKMYSQEEDHDIMKMCKKYRLKILNKYEYKLDGDDIKRIIYIIKKS